MTFNHTCGQQYDTPLAETIKDSYFESPDGISICLREYENTDSKRLIVKKKRDKDGVIQVERQRYTTESNEGSTLEDLIAKFNKQHGGFSIDVPKENPKCIIYTTRINAENEDGTVIRRDCSKVMTEKGSIEMPETIEIECADKNTMKEVKKQLSGFLDQQGIKPEEITTKETKEEQAMRMLEEQRSR